MINSILLDDSSVFKNNIAIQGGVFYCANCTLNLTNSSVYNSIARDGGVFYVIDEIKFSSSNVSLINQ